MFGQRGLGGGGFRWRELLERQLEEREPTQLAGVRVVPFPEGLWIEPRGDESPSGVVTHLRELLSDGSRLEALATSPWPAVARQARSGLDD